MAGTREDHIKSIQVGTTVAFKLGDQMFSGKVHQINDGTFTIQTQNNSIYEVPVDDISWVKTGSRYPQGIYNALKHTKEGVI